MNILELSEQEIVRRESMARMREMGIEPYPAAEFPVTGYTDEIRANFTDPALDGEGNPLPGQEMRRVSIAGRVMSRRIMGKASFMELQDSRGRIQVYVNRDEICPGDDKELYNTVFKKLLDIGDFVGVEGFVFRTQTGEISVHAQSLKVLSKSLRPLPVVKVKDGVTYDAFDDPELRYRRRYVDLVVNDGVKETFIKRTKVFNAMRRYFNDHGYMEVETPILQSIPGGASARPFITHHNALDIPLYLRIADELYLKRLIVGGFEGVYEFSKNFDKIGLSLTLVGEDADLQTTLSFYEKGMGGFYSLNLDENKQVQITQIEDKNPSDMTPEQANYYKALNKIVTDERDTKINIVESLSVPIGDAAIQSVAISDIQTLGEGEWLNGASALMHETFEQYQVQVKGIKLTKAHIQATSMEQQVTGAYIPPFDRFFDNGQMVLPVFKDASDTSSENRIGTVILHLNDKNNVSSVERKKWQK